MMRHSNPDMLFYIAMADAYAAAVEYIKLPERNALRDECLAFQKYLAHPTHGNPPGTYTDDTEMSVANTRVILHNNEPFTPLMFAEEYVREFQRGGRRKGYSRGFQAILETVRTGAELLAKIRPDSTKNGAAMRAVPFGVLPTVEQALNVATLQARITHDTPEGRFSARAVALMSHAALYEDLPLSDLGEYCQKYLPEEDLKSFGYVFSQPWPEKPVKSLPEVSVAISTVHAVVDVLVRENSLMGILKRIIEWGGDTDSVAAIAWGIASARYQNEKLPLFLKLDLEGGNKRLEVDCLRVLGVLLMHKYM